MTPLVRIKVEDRVRCNECARLFSKLNSELLCKTCAPKVRARRARQREAMIRRRSKKF